MFITSLIFFIEQISTGLYILLGLGALLAFRSLRRAQQELDAALFELEREILLARRARAINALGGFVLSFLAVVAISTVVAPELRAHPLRIAQRQVEEIPFVTARPTPTITPLAADTIVPPLAVAATPSPTPTYTPLPRSTDVFSGEVEATFTFTPTPPGTVIPDAPPPIGCNDPGAIITLPVNGQVIQEVIPVTGSASTPGFASYKFELNGPSTNDVWSVLRTYTTPVENGVLGQLDGSAFLPGMYQFRLTVVDTTDHPIASCTITIVIAEPATPTPTPSPIVGP